MAATYTVRVKDSAEREFRRLPQEDIQRILKRLQQLASHPRPPGCEKLTGEDGYRIRQGDYRILYAVDDAQRVVQVLRIGHRREVYR